MTLTEETQRLDETNNEVVEYDSNGRSTIRYIVYPKDYYPADETHPLHQLLESFGPQSVTKLYTKIYVCFGIGFWTLHPKASEVKILEESSLVYEVKPDRPVIGISM